MVIQKVTGGKPQEVKQTEKVDRTDRDASKSVSDKKGSVTSNASEQVTMEVSDRSKAAIKAYRIAMESKPNLSRASKVAQIKAKVLQGSYNPNSTDVASAILDNVVNESVKKS